MRPADFLYLSDRLKLKVGKCVTIFFVSFYSLSTQPFREEGVGPSEREHIATFHVLRRLRHGTFPLLSIL